MALYKELHPKGLNIISVSLDTEAAKWKKAILKDGLTWYQVSNLKGWEDPVAKQFEVVETPTLFILNATGEIVGKDLRGEALKKKILELIPLSR